MIGFTDKANFKSIIWKINLVSFFRTFNEEKFTDCVCGVGIKGLFKSISYKPCPSTYFDLTCRTLITDTITYSYLASDRQKRLGTNTPIHHPVEDRVIKRAKSVNMIMKYDLQYYRNSKEGGYEGWYSTVLHLLILASIIIIVFTAVSLISTSFKNKTPKELINLIAVC